MGCTSKNIKDIVIVDCPIRNVLSRICDKWSLLVVYTIYKNDRNKCRFNELLRKMPDISQKMLTSTLKRLETDGYVTRKVFAEVPPRVEYSLTERTNTLVPVIDSLLAWATDNMSDIMKDREKNSNK